MPVQRHNEMKLSLQLVQSCEDVGGIPALKLIQNAAARVLTGTGKEMITRWLLSLAARKKDPE